MLPVSTYVHKSVLRSIVQIQVTDDDISKVIKDLVNTTQVQELCSRRNRVDLSNIETFKKLVTVRKLDITDDKIKKMKLEEKRKLFNNLDEYGLAREIEQILPQEIEE